VGDTDVASYVSFAPDGRSLLANGAAQAGNINLCLSGLATGRQIAIHEGDEIDEDGLAGLFRQIIDHNRAGGWRKLRR
jgi:hypothetical protein